MSSARRSLPDNLSNQIERIQTRAFRMLFSEASYGEALQMTGMSTLYERRETLCKELFQSICESINHKLFNLLPALNNNEFDLKSNSKYILFTFVMKHVFISVLIFIVSLKFM